MVVNYLLKFVEVNELVKVNWDLRKYLRIYFGNNEVE